MSAKLFVKHICEWVSFQWSSKKERRKEKKNDHSKQNFSTDVLPNFTDKVVETNKRDISWIILVAKISRVRQLLVKLLVISFIIPCFCFKHDFFQKFSFLICNYWMEQSWDISTLNAKRFLKKCPSIDKALS